LYSLLIVDDEYQTRSGLRDLVKWNELGIQVVGDAEDGDEALSMLGTLHPDILLTDVRMNRMDGITLATRARERFPEITIVFISGYSEPKYLRNALRIEAVDYLYKPIHISELKSLMKRIAERLDARAKVQTDREKMRLLVEKSKPLLVERFLHSWFSGMLEDTDAIRERLNLLDLPFPAQGIVAAVFQPNWPTLPGIGQTEEYQVSLEKMIHQTLPNALTCAEDTGVIALLSVQDTSALRNAVGSIVEQMKKASAIGLTIGISGRHSNWTDASLAVSEASQALAQQTASDETIVFYSPTEDGNDVSLPYGELLSAQKFERILMTGDFEALWSCISETLSKIRHTAHSTEMTRKFMLHCALQTDLLLESQKLPGIQSADFCRHVLGRMPISAVQSSLKNLLSSACEQIGKMHERAYSLAVNKALSIIQNRFCERLSVEDIAEYVHYSSAHLSSLFRQETGMTIGDALLRTRINAATALLRTTTQSVSSIALKTGYGDVQYFSRVFKRSTGMTPLEYRRKALSC